MTIVPIDTRYVYDTLKDLKDNKYRLNIVLPIVSNDPYHRGYEVRYFTGINIIRYFSNIESSYDLDFERNIFYNLKDVLNFILLFEDEINESQDYYTVNRFLYEVIDVDSFPNDKFFQEKIKDNEYLLKKYYQTFVEDKIDEKDVTNNVWALFQEFLPIEFYWKLIENKLVDEQIYFVNKYIYKEELKTIFNSILNLRGDS